MKISEEKLNRIKENIFPHSIDAIDIETFDWHKNNYDDIQAYKPNSSQAVAIDVFGLLKLSKYKDRLINLYFNKSGEDWKIEFEWSDHELLNENPKFPTKIDVKIHNAENILLLECKFMEPDFGSGCSKTKPKNGDVECNGSYTPKKFTLIKCALTEINKTKYWDYIPKIFEYEKEKDYETCPCRTNQYQLIRNLCIGKALSEKPPKKKIENYLIYYNSETCPLSKKIKEKTFLENLKDEKSLKDISYNDLLTGFMNILKLNGQEEYYKWEELEKWLENKIKKCIKDKIREQLTKNHNNEWVKELDKTLNILVQKIDKIEIDDENIKIYENNEFIIRSAEVTYIMGNEECEKSFAACTGEYWYIEGDFNVNFRIFFNKNNLIFETFNAAVKAGDTEKVTELLTEEAKVNVSRLDRYDRCSLVTCAIEKDHNEILKMLLDGFVKTNIDGRGSLYNPASSALVVAAENGNIEAVKILLEYGGGAHRCDLCDAVLYAAVGGHYEIVKILVDSDPKMLYHKEF